MVQKQPKNADEAMQEIRRLLADLLDATDLAGKPVARIMRLLDLVEEGLKKEPPRGRASKGREKRVHTVETTASGEFLTESGGDDTSPAFRVSRNIYDLTAEVLANSTKPMRFEDILASVTQKAPAPPGDHQIRVCIRFWLGVDPPLLARGKSMYYPTNRASFQLATTKLWQSSSLKR